MAQKIVLISKDIDTHINLLTENVLFSGVLTERNTEIKEKIIVTCRRHCPSAFRRLIAGLSTFLLLTIASMGAMRVSEIERVVKDL